MKLEIWSDVMCPFCYIGKRHLEQALEQFDDKQDLEIIWKSFQLNPNLPEKANPDQNVYEYLAESKGISVEQSKEMHHRVTEMASKAGLEYNFDKAVVVNSFKAHRVLQMAKTKGLGDAAEERIFSAHFTEGRDTSDEQTLTELGAEIGLSEDEVNQALTDPQFANLVQQDITESRQIGVSGVPFFVFDRKYAISGAQPPELFTQTLEKAHSEWKETQPSIQVESSSADSCDIDGNC